MSWTEQNSALTNWYSACISDDGSKIIAGADYLYMGTRTNKETFTWTVIGPQDSKRQWKAVICDTNCVNILACAYGQSIWKSSDSGTTWSITNSQNKNWTSITSNLDFTTMFAAVNGGYIYSSTNGTDWTQISASGSRSWSSVSSNDDSSILLATGGDIDDDGIIHKGTELGTVWNDTSSPTARWTCVDMDSTGQICIASDHGAHHETETENYYTGYIYENNNYGDGSWAAQTSLDQRGWISTTISGQADYSAVADHENGRVLIGSGVYPNTSWATQTDLGKRDWNFVTCNYDFSYLIAGGNDGFLWVYYKPTDSVNVLTGALVTTPIGQMNIQNLDIGDSVVVAPTTTSSGRLTAGVLTKKIIKIEITVVDTYNYKCFKKLRNGKKSLLFDPCIFKGKHYKYVNFCKFKKTYGEYVNKYRLILEGDNQIYTYYVNNVPVNSYPNRP